LIAFIAIFVLEIIVHGNLLMDLYRQTAPVWREQGQSREMMWLMTLGQLLFGLLLAFIYTKGYEAGKAGLKQGLRFGFLIGLLVSISSISVWYVVLPVPFALALGWGASGLANCLAAGAVIGLLYRN